MWGWSSHVESKLWWWESLHIGTESKGGKIRHSEWLKEEDFCIGEYRLKVIQTNRMLTITLCLTPSTFKRGKMAKKIIIEHVIEDPQHQGWGNHLFSFGQAAKLSFLTRHLSEERAMKCAREKWRKLLTKQVMFFLKLSICDLLHL